MSCIYIICILEILLSTSHDSRHNYDLLPSIISIESDIQSIYI